MGDTDTASATLGAIAGIVSSAIATMAWIASVMASGSQSFLGWGIGHASSPKSQGLISS
ncbi:hypothetical protein [Ramlibacter montanisoli]|uniref:hypothetical protein n=1 Tax=Ramlibacter montanisoli TaxID=2732512 RepID=UPI00209BCC25|nr:hypothetical protein [Ramlibacter montanisoli]